MPDNWGGVERPEEKFLVKRKLAVMWHAIAPTDDLDTLTSTKYLDMVGWVVTISHPLTGQLGFDTGDLKFNSFTPNIQLVHAFYAMAIVRTQVRILDKVDPV